MTVTEYRGYNPNDTGSDSVLQARLAGLESMIRAYTNNNFQKRSFRFCCPILSGKLYYASNYVSVGDTVELSETAFNDGVYTISAKSSTEIALNETLYDEDYALVTKIVYPDDVKMGVVNLMRWEDENRDKLGVASETISRHAVTYFNMDGENSLAGYPKSLLGFLTPYMKARF